MRIVKSTLKKVGAFPWVSKIYHRVIYAKRKVTGVDRRRIKLYMKLPGNKKLQLGCGEHPLDGWLNSDLYPHKNEVYINALKRFPLSDANFDYVYSEHMIEHIKYQECLNMFSECYRILKPGGKLRVSTPDLKFLIDLYDHNKSDLQIKYMHWSVGNSLQDVETFGGTFVINRFMHSWGHTFIYDFKTLRLALEKTGFVSIEKQKPSHSNDLELKGLEFTERLPAGFIELESLVVEARKP